MTLPPSPPIRPHRPAAAALLGCAGALLFTLQDAAFKWYSTDHAVLQIIFLRSLPALLVSALWVRQQGGVRALRLPRPRLFLLSLAANLIAWIAFYTGLSQLPLTAAICIFFLTPIVIAVAAVPCLGEALSWRQSAALLSGFAGVAIITDPFSAATNIPLPAVACILVSVIMWSTMAIVTRALSTSTTIGATLFYNNLAFLLFSAVFLAAIWTPPTPAAALGMTLLGALGVAAQACVFSAYRAANTAIAATTEYTALVWAALLGYLLWGEQFTPRMAAGAVLIIAAGLAVLHRPRSPRRHPPYPRPATAGATHTPRQTTRTNRHH